MRHLFGELKYHHERLVVGSSLEALLYCYLNDLPFIYTKLERPSRFEAFSPDLNLEAFGIENTRCTLRSPTGERVIGIQRNILWEKLYFFLSLSGLCPLANKAASLRVEEGQVKVYTQGASTVTFTYDQLVIFSDEGVLGLPEKKPDPDPIYKVLDWFDVRSGLKHDLDFIEGEDCFVKEILFYPTERIDGDQKLKDAVSISYLREGDINKEAYSDFNARFKTLYLMKKAGIKGRRNGRDQQNKNKYKYYAVRIENSHRQILPMTELSYESSGNITFNKDSFDVILKKNCPNSSYVTKILH